MSQISNIQKFFKIIDVYGYDFDNTIIRDDEGIKCAYQKALHSIDIIAHPKNSTQTLKSLYYRDIGFEDLSKKEPVVNGEIQNLIVQTKDAIGELFKYVDNNGCDVLVAFAENYQMMNKKAEDLMGLVGVYYNNYSYAYTNNKDDALAGMLTAIKLLPSLYTRNISVRGFTEKLMWPSKPNLRIIK